MAWCHLDPYSGSQGSQMAKSSINDVGENIRFWAGEGDELGKRTLWTAVRSWKLPFLVIRMHFLSFRGENSQRIILPRPIWGSTTFTQTFFSSRTCWNSIHTSAVHGWPPTSPRSASFGGWVLTRTPSASKILRVITWRQTPTELKSVQFAGTKIISGYLTGEKNTRFKV